MSVASGSGGMSGASRGGTPALLELRRLGVAHEVHAYDHHPSAASYGREAAEALGVEPARVLKTLMAEVDGRPTVAIVPVTGSLDLKALARAVGGKKARMLPVASAERLTGYVAGGISPLGQRTTSATVIDSSAADFATVFVSAGRRGLDVEIAPEDLIRLTAARTAAISGG